MTGLPADATGTAGRSRPEVSTLCVAVTPSTSCDTSTTLAPGTYLVTATYSGDGNYNGATVTGATFTVTKADTTMTESASPSTIAHGAQDIAVNGLPARRRNGDGDVHVGRHHALHRNAACTQLPDVDVARRPGRIR